MKTNPISPLWIACCTLAMLCLGPGPHDEGLTTEQLVHAERVHAFLADALANDPTPDAAATAIVAAAMEIHGMSYFDLDTFDASLGGRAGAQQILDIFESLAGAGKADHAGGVPSGARPGQIFVDDASGDPVTKQVSADGLTATVLWERDGRPDHVRAIAIDSSDSPYAVDPNGPNVIFVSGTTGAVDIDLYAIADQPGGFVTVIRTDETAANAVTVSAASGNFIQQAGAEAVPNEITLDDVNDVVRLMGTDKFASTWLILQDYLHKVKTITSADSPYTMAFEDHYLLVDASSGAVTVNLADVGRAPAREDPGYTVKLIDATNACTIQKSGKTIDGASTKVLSAANEFVKIISNRDNYFIVGAG